VIKTPLSTPLSTTISTTISTTTGRHVLADFKGVDASLLRDAGKLEQLIQAAALASGASVLSCHFHRFGEGQGVTGVALLAESHISIHTWPEHEFAALDVYMCGASDPNLAAQYMAVQLNAKKQYVRCFERGA
jgi:S-adenosylmethionine decarboxylase